MKIVLVNSNPIYSNLEKAIRNKYGSNCWVLNRKEDLTITFLQEVQPDYIFFPHWSYIIPKVIYSNYECVVFHMTDLPFGRGGTPLQNLIIRGIENTKLSALRVTRGIDTGDIYLKKDLSLLGTADEIFLRTSNLIESMIKEIVEQKPKPVPQEGEIVEFKRRTPQESNVFSISDARKLYDYIRMLDSEEYPNAFLETEHFRFEFSRASLKKDYILADVRIFKK